MKIDKLAIAVLLTACMTVFPVFAQETPATEEQQAEEQTASAEFNFETAFMVELGLGLGLLASYTDSTGIVLPIGASVVIVDFPMGMTKGLVSVGLKWEPGLILGASSTSLQLTLVQSITATGDFYWQLEEGLDILPFAGLSLGWYNAASLSTSAGSGDGSFFGFAPRIGIRLDGINGYISYHFALGTATPNPSYFSIVAGYTFGGARLNQ